MFNAAKSEAICRGLKERLDLRFKDQGLSCAQSFDSSGYSVLTLSDGSPASAEKVILIRVRQIDAVSKDIFGNANLAFSPHIMDIAYEDASAFAGVDWAKLSIEVAKEGIKAIVYKAVAGAIPALSDMVPAKQEAALEFDILWPSKGA